jgi:SAM-dependent methyltransferase
MSSLFERADAQDRLHRSGLFDYLDRYPFSLRYRATAAVVRSVVGSQIAVLDIGAGSGATFAELAPDVTHYTYTDISEHAVAGFVARHGGAPGFDEMVDILVGDVAGFALPQRQHAILGLGLCRGVYLDGLFRELFDAHLEADRGVMILEGATAEVSGMDRYVQRLPAPVATVHFEFPTTDASRGAPLRRSMITYSKAPCSEAQLVSIIESAIAGEVSSPG